MKFKRNAYMIIELLVTLAICGILAAVLLPVFRSAHENGHGSSCPMNLKQIGLGFLQYAQDADEHLPPIALHANASETQPYGWADALQPYLTFGNRHTASTCSASIQSALRASINERTARIMKIKHSTFNAALS